MKQLRRSPGFYNIECMEEKLPKVVVTDGDNAMQTALSKLFPTAIHRLCAWHLTTNARTNVPNVDFEIQFSKLLYHYYTTDEFEDL